MKIVLAQSFGKGKDCSPGKSNDAIANCIHGSIDSGDAGVTVYYLQAEVDDSLQKIMPDLDNNRFVRIGSEKERITTKEVLDEVWNKVRNKQKDNDGLSVKLYGHSDHLPRVILLAQKVFEEADIFSANCEDVPYDSESIQWWTQNKKSFVFFELLSHIHHLLHGYFRREDIPTVLSYMRKHLLSTMKNPLKTSAKNIRNLMKHGFSDGE